MDDGLLRMFDADLNRAREGLRVVEDHARFVLNDEPLCGELKALRHELAEATRAVAPDAMLHRDTPNDVGTRLSTEAEGRRAGLRDIVVAAGKRIGEALRALEECLKVLSSADAPRLEALRYRFYSIEQRVALTLRTSSRLRDAKLYVLVTERLCRIPWLEAAEQAILGGADVLQLREKELESGELLRRATALSALCRRHGVPCIVNDRPDIAVLSGADGVHVGQQDLPAAMARKIVGDARLVGVSTHELAQARQALLDGADYIGVGPFFRSKTKPRDFIAGPDYARQAATVDLPAFAIAGVDADNVDEVLATGLKAVAVSSAVLSADEVRAAAERLKRKLTMFARRPATQE